MVTLENVTKTYRTKRGELNALTEVNLYINKGEFVVLQGPSGSGKTTLLMTVAAMLRPTSGKVIVDQNDLYSMAIRERAKFRARNIGFVFQMFHLVPYLNIVENVLLAGRLLDQSDRTRTAEELLKQLGLADRATHRPAELSAGEKQRAAIARAMFNRPRMILADEPTGNLDPDNATSVLKHLAEFHRAGGTVILATHGQTAQQFADRVIHLRGGLLKQSG